jgi:Uma2 family endonuclease
MASLPLQFATVEEYFEFERQAETRHEYIEGYIVDMAGGSVEHDRIASNLNAALVHRLRGKCSVFGSDLRIGSPGSRTVSYPDISVICGPAIRADHDRDTLVNPIVIAEVLSPSTADLDRGTKARAYWRIPSMREYLIVAQSQIEIEHWERAGSGIWQLTETIADPSAVLSLRSLGIELPVDEIYYGVDFSSATPPDAL